jgi:hypothetical protein
MLEIATRRAVPRVIWQHELSLLSLSSRKKMRLVRGPLLDLKTVISVRNAGIDVLPMPRKAGAELLEMLWQTALIDATTRPAVQATALAADLFSGFVFSLGYCHAL